MKRFMKRMLFALLGVALGWYAAGFLPATTVSFAGEELDTPKQVDRRATASLHGDDGTSADAGEALRPQRIDLPWVYILTAIAVLFVAAVVLGIPAKILKGPDPPDPAAHDVH